MARCGRCGAQRSLGAGERDRSLPLLAEIDHGHDDFHRPFLPSFPPLLLSPSGPLLGCVLKTIVRDLRFDFCLVSSQSGPGWSSGQSDIRSFIGQNQGRPQVGARQGDMHGPCLGFGHAEA